MGLSPEEEHPVKAFGWAARDSSGHLSPFNFSRRETGEEDVRLKILYCGLCVADLLAMKNEFSDAQTIYPLVPGHEIVGEVTQVGCKVIKFKVGDKVGVGTLVGACHSCESCMESFEIFCRKRIFSFNFIDHNDGTVTYGGLSNHMVANERYVVRFPDNILLHTAPPLLCAGITVYSPLKYFRLAESEKHVGIVGLGGLGHLAVKFAKAMGAKVTVISSSLSKKIDALERLGADSFLHSSDHDEMQAAMGSMDGILDTVSVSHPITPLIDLLKSHGQLVLVGPDNSLEIPTLPLTKGRKTVAGSAYGATYEIQEMIDFAAKHNINADVEVISVDYLNQATKRLAKADVKYRFVVDVGNTLPSTNSTFN
ncbi:8-hydroxygeraniol dehydrogenase-like isoform X1 [Carica papaya]|uniref:8-hydroxygeraniol dehydrogenase-like isoform X1 n=1 Tax=Carica papaya TaxID=3649 RepID=UPI000B8D001B|nr:8-hydroxygeraniol dehydrogenase-like isoform X1 [Carica papaya]